MIVGAWAAVRLVDGSYRRGVVYTIDPEKGHVVLLQTADGTKSNGGNGASSADDCAVTPLVLPSSSIESFVQEEAAECLLGPGVTLQRVDVKSAPASSQAIAASPVASKSLTSDLFEDEPEDDEDAACERRRAAICALLTEQQVPFAIEQPGGTLTVLDCLHIGSPFTASSCRCENALILERFKKGVLDRIKE